MSDCNSERAAAAVAQIHINRAAMVLSAANDISQLTGTVYRNALTMALKALGEASAAITVGHQERDLAEAKVELLELRLTAVSKEKSHV